MERFLLISESDARGHTHRQPERKVISVSHWNVLQIIRQHAKLFPFKLIF